ncbi:hypothetical protein OP068_000746 [Salmonella enterica]|nr:hypothetical protein [Salmonella enterica]ECZ7726945.1 hypothetical protein [Salmonella enterica subsp. enterica serovar Rubislaw]EDT8626195.1 hypothetical protein [Salmonella enterica subsp. enterica serovar Oranienburg]EKC4533282.1 hypothetical protein [Salmonella enterica subsp. enterica]EBS9448736.1 hypothetical protein [Salmonella enterica]
MIDKKIFRGFSLSAVRECFRQTAKSTRRKSNRIHQLLNATRNRSCDYSIALLVVINLSVIVCGSFLAYGPVTGRQRREISLFMKILRGVLFCCLLYIIDK